MHLSKIKKLSIALCMTILPISVFAAGLGQLNIASGIGEPLKADIELLSVTASEMATLKAKIAPEATYAAQGLERPATHNDISVQVSKDASGKDILKLKSGQPITEPFLDMLVEVEWETGRILREYTVLLDPPGYKNEVSASQIQAPTIKSTDNAPVKNIVPEVKKTPTESTVQTKPVSSAQAEDTIPVSDYLTQKGDTLTKIATRMRPEGVSLDQMLIGLFEANPEAFSGKNMNRLKVGKILQTPTEEALNAITRKEAVKEIKLQTANWNEYRNKLAGIVAESAPESSEVDTQSTSGKIKPAAEDQSIPESTGPKDVVKLSSSSTNANEADMQAKIIALQEEVSAREKGLKEAQERTAALEKQIDDMQKLLTLKNNDMLEAQQQSAQVSEAAAEPTAVEPAAEAKPEEGSKPVEVATEPKPAEKPAAQPKPVAQPTSANAPVEEQSSFISSLLDNFSGMFGGLDTTLLGAGAGLIALLTGGWFYLRNKRKKNLADFEQGIMTSGGLKANTVFGNTSGASVDTGDTSFLTDFSQSTSGGMIDTNDVDPIAEAEVYMAYGRDAQAEEILKDAISKEPKRYELHLKLLEMYAASKDMSAFETVSGELYTTLGSDDPTWAKVAEIGIKLEPNNPLYKAKAGVGADAGESADENADEKLDATDFSDSPLAAEADLDFSLTDDAGTDSKPEVEESLATAETEMKEEADISVDESALDIPNVSEVLETQDSALEFDLNTLNDQQVEDDVPTVTLDEANFAHTMPNLDFPKLEGEESASDADISMPEPDSSDTSSLPEVEMPSDLSFDMPQTTEAPEIAIDQNARPETEEKTSVESFDFDIDTITGDTLTSEEADNDQEEVSADQVNVLDMSGISLEVNDDVNNAIAEATPEVEPEVASTEPESEEVETKLELVAAYIDMEDKEGAKELLDEVIKEGGANQRERAEQILATLG